MPISSGQPTAGLTTCTVFRPGLVAYDDAWDLQRALHEEIVDGLRTEALLLLEHPHVYTLGRRGEDSDILVGESKLRELGVEVRHTDRGGQVTYHGPGQIVGYPMLNLRARRSSPLDYVRALERVVIDTLAELGVEAESEDRPTGVWIGDAKIAAIGVKVSRAVTMHGFALNVDPDLTYFDQIVACGLPEAKATSISRELGRPVTVESAMDSLLPHFERVFEAVTALG